MFPQKVGAQVGGMEMMFRSLGLGPALDGMKAFVEAGGLQKIMEFANALPAITSELRELRKEVGELREAAGLPAIRHNDDAELEPGPGDGDGEPDDPGIGAGPSEQPEPAGRSRRARAANGAAHV